MSSAPSPEHFICRVSRRSLRYPTSIARSLFSNPPSARGSSSGAANMSNHPKTRARLSVSLSATMGPPAGSARVPRQADDVPVRVGDDGLPLTPRLVGRRAHHCNPAFTAVVTASTSSTPNVTAIPAGPGVDGRWCSTTSTPSGSVSATIPGAADSAGKASTSR